MITHTLTDIEVQKTAAEIFTPCYKSIKAQTSIASGLGILLALSIPLMVAADKGNWPWNWKMAGGLVGLNLLWVGVMIIKWKPFFLEEAYRLSPRQLDYRLHQSEAWYRLWNGGFAALFSLALLWGGLAGVNVTFPAGWITGLLLFMYGVCWGGAVWQKNLLLRIGIDPAYSGKWLMCLGVILVAMMQGLSLIPVIARTGVLPANVPYLAGSVGGMLLLTINYALIGYAVRQVTVAQIHFRVLKASTLEKE